jgi:uncharacterized protein YceK
MKLLILILFLLVTTGCAPVVGAHVQRITHKGVTYTKCVAVSEEDRPDLAHAALDICRAAIEHQPAAPLK